VVELHLPSMGQLQAAVNGTRTQQIPNEQIQKSAQKRARESAFKSLLQACNASPQHIEHIEVLGLPTHIQTKYTRTGSEGRVDPAFSYHDSKALIEGMAPLSSSHTGPSSDARCTDSGVSSTTMRTTLSDSGTSDRQSHQHNYHGHNLAYTRAGQNDVSGR